MLCAFGSVEEAAATVSGTIAAGILPAALEMMDAKITRAVEDFVGAGYPRDAEAVLLVELDGLAAGVAEQADAVREIAHEHGAVSARVAADEAERALLWKGRKSAFGAIARIAPDYYLHDAVVPRTKLVEVLRRVYEIADDHRVVTMNVFHAGDGNLHPLIVFDGREPGVWDRVHHAGTEILETCIAAGRCAHGRTRRGDREARPDAAAVLTRRPRRPSAAARRVRSRRCREPAQGPAPRQPLRRTAASAGGHVDLSALSRGRRRATPAVVAVGAQTQWELGAPSSAQGSARAGRSRCATNPRT